jgi:hypothetical protein
VINHTLYQNIKTAISAYARERYTFERKLSGTGIVSSDANISTDGEGFIGQLRWDKPLNATINVLSATDSTAGTPTDLATALATYIKTARASGAQQVNIAKIISQRDGLQKMAQDFAEVQGQDEPASARRRIRSSRGTCRSGVGFHDDARPAPWHIRHGQRSSGGARCSDDRDSQRTPQLGQRLARKAAGSHPPRRSPVSDATAPSGAVL